MMLVAMLTREVPPPAGGGNVGWCVQLMLVATSVTISMSHFGR